MSRKRAAKEPRAEQRPVIGCESERRSAALAVGQRMRHSLRRSRRPLNVWKGHRPGARRSAELDAVDLNILTLAGAFEHVVERAAGVTERVGPVGNDDRRLDLHTSSIARAEPQDESTGAHARCRRGLFAKTSAQVATARRMKAIHRDADANLARSDRPVSVSCRPCGVFSDSRAAGGPAQWSGCGPCRAGPSTNLEEARCLAPS